MPVRDRKDELVEATREKEIKEAEAEQETENQIDEVPTDTAEIEEKEVAETETIAKQQELERQEPLTTGEMHELQEYIKLIDDGSRIKNKDFEPYERKNGQLILELEGNGGRGQATNPKFFPYIIDEFKRQYEEDPKKFAKTRPAPEPNIAAKAPTITPSQAVKDSTFSLLPRRADQPVLGGAIDKMTWWLDAVYQIGMNCTMLALNVAKMDVNKLPELLSSFEDKDVFVKYVTDHSIALVQAAGDVQALQKLQEIVRSDIVKIEMLTMELENYQTERNELVRQVQLCVESMCSQDLQAFSTKRILASAAINTGMIFPMMGGNPLTSLNTPQANGHAEPQMLPTNQPNGSSVTNGPYYTIQNGKLVEVR